MPVVHSQLAINSFWRNVFLYSKAKGLKEINISFKSHSMDQQKTVQYLSMISKGIEKIIAKLKLVYQLSRYQTPVFKRLLCNVLIQPHFGYGFSIWFLLFFKN